MSNRTCQWCHSQLHVSWVVFIVPKSCIVKIEMQIYWCLLEVYGGKKGRKRIKENILLVTAAILSKRCKHELKICLMRAWEGKQPAMHTKPAPGAGRGGRHWRKDNISDTAILIFQASSTHLSWLEWSEARLIFIFLLVHSSSRAEVVSSFPKSLQLSCSSILMLKRSKLGAILTWWNEFLITVIESFFSSLLLYLLIFSG